MTASRVMNGWLASALALAGGILVAPIAIVSILGVAFSCAPGDGQAIASGSVHAWMCSEPGQGVFLGIVLGALAVFCDAECFS